MREPVPPLGDLERRLRAAAGGDVTAFEELYDAVCPTVYGLALCMLDDVAEAEDLTRQVLIEVWRTAARFDSTSGSALSWVLLQAHRIAVDRVRDASPRRAGLSRPDAPASWKGLPPDELRALELAYFDGRTHAEIGADLSLPTGGAASRIRAGLHTLERAQRSTTG